MQLPASQPFQWMRPRSNTIVHKRTALFHGDQNQQQEDSRIRQDDAKADLGNSDERRQNSWTPVMRQRINPPAANRVTFPIAISAWHRKESFNLSQ